MPMQAGLESPFMTLNATTGWHLPYVETATSSFAGDWVGEFYPPQNVIFSMQPLFGPSTMTIVAVGRSFQVTSMNISGIDYIPGLGQMLTFFSFSPTNMIFYEPSVGAYVFPATRRGSRITGFMEHLNGEDPTTQPQPTPGDTAFTDFDGPYWFER